MQQIPGAACACSLTRAQHTYKLMKGANIQWCVIHYYVNPLVYVCVRCPVELEALHRNIWPLVEETDEG